MKLMTITQRPSALPAAAVAFRMRSPFAGLFDLDAVVIDVVRARDGVAAPLATPQLREGLAEGLGKGVVVETPCGMPELAADNRVVIEGTSVSASVSGYPVAVQKAHVQVNAGIAGVGGDPPRGRPI